MSGKGRPLRHRGFTLIELVVVILVLGVIAVIAAPRFINLSSDAKISVLQSIAGDMKSIVTIVHAKATIDNTSDTGPDADRMLETNLGLVDTWYKYPETVAEQGAVFGIVELLSLDDNGITVFEETGTMQCNSIKIGWDSKGCFVEYTEACSETEPPIIEVDSTLC